MAGFNHLFVPGPTNVPEVVRQAMNMPMEDMRSPDYPTFTHGLFVDLLKVFGNEGGRAFIFPSSGTGAWEAAIANTLAAGHVQMIAQSVQQGDTRLDVGGHSLAVDGQAHFDRSRPALWHRASRLGLSLGLCQQRQRGRAQRRRDRAGTGTSEEVAA